MNRNLDVHNVKSYNRRKVMLKKIGMIVAGLCLALSCMGEEFSGRVACGGIEWLYTIDIANRKLVLEKAILLAAENYSINMQLGNLMYEISYDASMSFDEYEWDICFGPSAFENNEYLEGICFIHGPGFKAANLIFDENSFKNCVNLSRIIVDGAQDGIYIRDIKKSAFEGCLRLGNLFGVEYYDVENKNLQAWSSLTNIGERAFYEMGRDISSSMSLFLSEGVKISAEAFYGSASWDCIYLPKKMDEIKTSAFQMCSAKINLPQEVKSIGVCAFEKAYMRRNEDLILPKYLEILESSAFEGAGYKSLTLSDILNYIGSYAFAGRVERLPNGNIEYPSCLSGEINIPSSIRYIGHNAFAYNPLLRKVIISSGLEELNCGIFEKCFSLEDVIIPNTVLKIASDTFLECTNLSVTIPSSVVEITPRNPSLLLSKAGPKEIVFEGLPPSGVAASLLLDAREILVPIEYQSQWAPYFRPNMKFAKKVDGEWVALGGKVISNAMRPSDPTIMDIKYKVTSTKDKVNVRILAFEDGNRSFAKVLRPETFVDGTEANVGDGVAANVEHTVSWQVSKDWDVDLAKVSIEVYVKEDNLLPLSLTTIPAMGERASVTFSRNVPNEEKVMNALYWLYADKAADLTLANGVLKCGNTQLVNGSSLSAANAVSYIYSKMGYGTLSGDTLNYVNGLTRLGLSPSGIKQYAVKEGAAE